MDILQIAADSILASDRRMAPEYGGGRFAGVDRVTVDNEAETVTLHDRVSGAALVAKVSTHGIHRPKDRAIAPGDVHDAILEAMLSAVGA